MDVPSKCIALYGGSFNPIHNGHIELIKKVLTFNIFEEVWLIVSPQNPLKKYDELLSEEIRLLLAKEAVSPLKNVFVSDIEMRLPKPSFTWITLQALKLLYPQYKFCLLIGADNWLNFDKWKNYKDILAEFSIYIYPRKNYNVVIEQLPLNVFLLDLPLYPISSTEVRHKIKNNRSIKDMVPKVVYEWYQSQKK